ncbi:hypothetical protein EUTSA_v10009702mg [Eutrema salsugineum]|uniref:DUF7036 domain-containing protein n=1 Tax=Eutrema salsugineum TaxID=72664 RepID=V4KWN9_EUTSA|nr:uncharacterized protein LOC18993793 [Eutrema salsugineum]ESQ35769.1 hypothetical protein EUTSA_v10009702mg [Eutrema salsugineum]
MGKHSKENDHGQQQQNLDPENPRFFCRSCSSALSRLFGLGCVIFLALSFAILLSAIFCLFPRRSPSHFDADEIVKLTASAQAYFRLHKPTSEVISHKRRLEKDIFRSIDLKNTKVTILSLHQSDASNHTDVEFAVLPVPPDYTIKKDDLTSLRTSFVKLFSQRWNMNLTTSSFGKPTSFQVLKFPGGITVDPLGSRPVSGVLEILFNFTLGISISEIQDKLAQLKSQLELVLRLEPYETVHVLLTNEEGSTISHPVTVQVYVVSTIGNHLQQRLDHLAQVIQTSRAKNLGLDNSVFGEVKSITFSTYLEGKILDSALVLKPAPNSCFPSLC